ncbi:MAG: hypothetical protein GX628_05220 [Clostridiales bacterium]|nr:hypothetical protein [Clostridiales bacterium]
MSKQYTKQVKHVLELRTDGSYDIIPVRGEPSLQLLQRLTGGNSKIEFLGCWACFGETLVMLFNSDSMELRAEFNKAASALFDKPGYDIYGPAAVITVDDDDCVFNGLDSEVIGHVINALRYMDVLGEHIDGRDYRRQKGAGE